MSTLRDKKGRFVRLGRVAKKEFVFLEGNRHVSIPLTQEKFAIIDEEDFEKVNKSKWQYHPRQHLEYARGRVNGKMTYLHRFILNAKKGQEIDHINGNGLDNRKNNLQFVAHQENLAKQGVRKDSTSGIKGVWINKSLASKGKYLLNGGLRKIWVAELCINGKKKGLGYFRTKKEASSAYNKAFRECYKHIQV